MQCNSALGYVLRVCQAACPKLAAAATASVLMIGGAYAADGARAYFALPDGTNDLEFTADFLQTEIDGSTINSFTVTPSYTRTLDIFGDSGTFLIGLPIGALNASFNEMGTIVDMSTSPAQGDAFVGATLGLIGSPSLTPMAYAQFKPGFAVSVATKLFLPTGDYDSTRPLNLGQNRWSLQTSLPISYVLGGSLLDPQLTTFEIEPSVQVFGDNDRPFGGPTVTSEAPLFGLESHVTHSFSHTVWASLDESAEFGGETSANGVGNNDAQQAVSLGATLGLVLSQSVDLRVNYQQQVYSNTPGNTTREFVATTAFPFSRRARRLNRRSLAAVHWRRRG